MLFINCLFVNYCRFSILYMRGLKIRLNFIAKIGRFVKRA